jgi:DNA-binding PadR family transcriptional regulator
MGNPKGRKNRTWSKEEKLRIVRRYLDEGIGSDSLAKEENISGGMLRNWINKNIFCNEKHNKMERFMEVCLLCFLYEEPGYGYGLIQKLTLFGFTERTISLGSLYRTLRKMEKEGMVCSVWEQGSQGPKRRVYNITENGKEELKRWISVLKTRVVWIEKLIKRFESLNKK